MYPVYYICEAINCLNVIPTNDEGELLPDVDDNIYQNPFEIVSSTGILDKNTEIGRRIVDVNFDWQTPSANYS